MDLHVHSNTINDNQKIETVQMSIQFSSVAQLMSISGWLHWQTVVCIQQNITQPWKWVEYWYRFRMDGPQKCYTKWKKSDAKSSMFHSCKKKKKIQNTSIPRDWKWIGCLPGAGMRENKNCLTSLGFLFWE